MKYYRILIALVIALSFQHANAGFITGYIVGSSGRNNVQNTNAQPPVVVVSETHDVISCKANINGMCEVGYSTAGVSPAQHAGKLGYKTLYRTGVVISGELQFIVMEVSK